jgi:hypothetical protein
MTFITFYAALDNFNQTIPFTPKEAEEYQRLMLLGQARPVRFLSRLVCVKNLDALQVWLVEHSWMLAKRGESEKVLWKLDNISDPAERIYLIKERKELLEIVREADEKMRQLECPQGGDK